MFGETEVCLQWEDFICSMLSRRVCKLISQVHEGLAVFLVILKYGLLEWEVAYHPSSSEVIHYETLNQTIACPFSWHF